MQQDLMVTKRDGRQEKLDLEKIHRVVIWAAEGLDQVSPSEVELKAHIQFFEGMKTSDIHETLIKSAADLISEQTPDYQFLAARLAIFHLRKRAYGKFEPPKLFAHTKKMVADGRYDEHLLADYTEREFDQLEKYIDHSRDMNFSYAAVKQLEGKYLVQNRVTGEIYESPQVLYMLVAACLFANHPQETRLRALGSPIRGGEAFHTGCIPFYKHFQTAVKSCSQGGVRGGAATLFYPIWHLEVESLLVLKNNRGVEENRVRHLDYGVQLNKLMYQRLIKGGFITLFSPHEVPGLYDAFFADQVEFERLYVKYEQDESIRKTRIKAAELFGMLASERASTGRIYIQNVDHCNTHSPFDPKVAPIKQSNLCLEIFVPLLIRFSNFYQLSVKKKIKGLNFKIQSLKLKIPTL